MRTKIDIDDELMAKAMRLSGPRTKKAVVEEAVRTLTQLKDHARIPGSRGKISWDGDLDRMRRDRDGDFDPFETYL